jgi:hypothetical protein
LTAGVGCGYGVGMSPLQTARILWWAMLAALAMYFVVLVGQRPGVPLTDVTTLHTVFAVLVVPTVGVILFFRRQLPSPERTPEPALPPLTTYTICWSLSEAIALYGLVLGFLSRSLDIAEPFFILGAGLLLWQRPRAAHFDA